MPAEPSQGTQRAVYLRLSRLGAPQLLADLALSVVPGGYSRQYGQTPFFALTFAQRFFCAADILALASADIFEPLRVGLAPL
jgi:hypothetical protein